MKTPVTSDPAQAKIRLNLEMAPEMYLLLHSLALYTNGTICDVLRKSIILLELAVDAKRKGQKFGIAEKDQPLATEIIGI